MHANLILRAPSSVRGTGRNVGSNVRTVRGSEPKIYAQDPAAGFQRNKKNHPRLAIVVSRGRLCGGSADALVQVGAPLRRAQSNVVASGYVTPGACCFIME